MRLWRRITGFQDGKARRTRSDAGLLMACGLGSIVLLLVLSLGLTWGVLETKSALRAYATGESLWSKGKEDTLHALSLYAETGDDQQLKHARAAISGPLGFKQGRVALENDPVDLEQAQQGFAQGGIYPDDIPRMIWLFRHSPDFHHFKQSVTAWQRTDPYILHLKSLSQPVTDAQEAEARQERIEADLDRIRQDLRPLETAFLAQLSEADRWVSRGLFISVAIALLLVTLISMGLFRWVAKRITQSERELRTTLEHAGVGMAVLDHRGMIKYANARLCEILDYPRDMLVDSPVSSLPDITENPLNIRLIKKAFENEAFRPRNNAVTLERQHFRNDDAPIWVKFTFSSGSLDTQEPDSYIMVAEDVSEAYNRVEELSHEANHDPLTGLFNRRELCRRLELAIRSAHSEDIRHVLAYIDLDGFKDINDTCGHRAGDLFLIELAELIRKQLREGDILGRLGGDEFAIILSYCPLEAALNILEALREEIEAFVFLWELQRFQVTASVGLVEIGPHSSDITETLERADDACYRAKRTGRNRIVAMTPDGKEKRPKSTRKS